MTGLLLRENSDRLQGWPSGPLRGEVRVPGDKSMSHRALILGGLATGETLIEGLLEGDDILHTAAAVRAFGPEVERLGDGRWRVAGAQWRSPPAPIDCGNAGTGARLLMGAAAGFPLRATFIGDASLSRRPMDRVLEPLRVLGAQADGVRLPVTVRGGALHGIRFHNQKASAQIKSAILLAGLRAAGEVEVIEPAPSRDHTEHMLRAFGCDVDSTGGCVRLGRNRLLSGTGVRIPGDPSSAAFPLVAALLCSGSELSFPAVLANPLRTGLLRTLQEMGADILVQNRRSVGGEPVAALLVRASRLRGVEVPASRTPSMIDEYPILAVAAAFAQGTTVMHGLGELRVKESDRLVAIVAGLGRCGVEARIEGDSLVVEGGTPRGHAEVEAHHDHRIAMSFLVLALAAQGPVRVDSASMIATSFPGFGALIRSVGGRIQ